MPRIACVCADPTVPVFGRKPASLHVQQMLRALRSAGAEVEIFASSLGDAPAWDLAAIPVHRFAGMKTIEAPIAELTSELDLVVRSAVQSRPRFEAIYERYCLGSSAALEFARSEGIPAVLEVCSPLLDERPKPHEVVDRGTAEDVTRRAFSAATSIIAVSSDAARYSERFGAEGSKIHVIPANVDATRFPPGVIPSRPAPAHVFTVGYVGTCKPWHGLGTLVEAFDTFARDHADSRLLIVGDGPEKEKTRADLVARGLLGKTEWTGAVGPEQVPSLLASMDVAAACYSDASELRFPPVKLFEYMAAGLPVVATRADGIADLVEDGRSGLLCPAGDCFAVAGAFSRLFESRELRHRLGRAAREKILGRCAWSARAERVLELAGFAATPAA